MKYNVREYLKQDRQWLRPQRINHAKYELERASNEQERQFWKDVISANEDENAR
jgi:hypothetical protein